MRHVLIVEDDRAMAQAIRLGLETGFGPSWGSSARAAVVLRIDVAFDLEAALRLVRNRPREEPFEVLISDVSMHSFEELAFLSHVVRGRFPGVHVLLISGQDDDDLAELAPQVSAHGWIGKPFSADRIVQTVRPWLVPDRGA